MPKEKEEWGHHKGKFLTTLGLVLVLIGGLRYYGLDWNLVLVVVGLFLLLKGLWLKMKSK